MSYTQILALSITDTHINYTHVVDEFSNSNTFSPIIWEYMAKKYLGGCIWYEDFSKILSLNIDPIVSETDIRLLFMSYDKAIVLKKDYTRAIDTLTRSLLSMRKYINNKSYVESFRSLIDAYSKSECDGIGLYSSLGDNDFDDCRIDGHYSVYDI